MGREIILGLHKLWHSSKSYICEKSILTIMKTFTLDEQLKITSLTKDILNLIDLDGTWTAFLKDKQSIPKMEIPVLENCVTQMDKALKQIEKIIPLLELNSVNNDDWDLLVGDISKHTDLKPDVKLKVQKKIKKLIATGLDEKHVIELISKEGPQLADKMSTIKSGGFSPGDLSKRGKCVLGLLICFGAGVSQAWALGAAGVLLAADNC